MKTRSFFLLLFAASAALASPADLRRRIENSPTLWVAYNAPIIAPGHMICGDDDWSSHGHCRDCLDASALTVLYRVEKGAIAAVRMASPECRSSVAPVTWIESVSPDDSIELLASLARQGDSVGKKAVGALAFHAGSTDRLIDLARNSSHSKIRTQALFWLSQQAGRKAAGVLREAVDRDPESKVRQTAVFGISQLPDDESIPILADLMRKHRDAGVRKKAAFWLGQKNDPRALAAIEQFLKQ